MNDITKIAAFGLVVCGMAGCERHAKSEKYFLVAANTKVPYWKAANDGFQQAGAAYGVTTSMVGPDGDDAGAEADAFKQAVDSKPAGILVSVVDAERMRPGIDAAIRSGIPVITVDSDAPDSARLFFIGTNNFQAGHLGAQKLISLLNGKGNVVFYSFPAQPNLADRLKGYLDGLSTHPGIKVVDVYDIKGDSGAAFDKTREYLARTGADKIDAFVSLDSVSGKDVADALKRQNITDRTLIAMDTSADVINLVKSGEIKATISQKPYTMGYVGLQALAQIHEDGAKNLTGHNESNPHSIYPSFVDTGTSLVDKSNVDTFSK